MKINEWMKVFNQGAKQKNKSKDNECLPPQELQKQPVRGVPRQRCS